MRNKNWFTSKEERILENIVILRKIIFQIETNDGLEAIQKTARNVESVSKLTEHSKNRLSVECQLKTSFGSEYDDKR